MSQLITQLCLAHGALLSAQEAPLQDGPAPEALASTARKIETTLLAALSPLDDAARTALLRPIANSGSLKALKMVPEGSYDIAPGFGRIAVDQNFIMKRPASYVHAMIKRGLQLSSAARVTLILQAGASAQTSQKNLVEILSAPGDRYDRMQIENILHALLTTEPLTAAAADLGEQVLRKMLRRDRARFEDLFGKKVVLHDPAAAAPGYGRILVALALLGVKSPPSARFESDLIESFVKKITSKEGRADLEAQTGGFAAFVRKANPEPQVLRGFDAYRARYRAPGVPRGSYRVYGGW